MRVARLGLVGGVQRGGVARRAGSPGGDERRREHGRRSRPHRPALRAGSRPRSSSAASVSSHEARLSPDHRARHHRSLRRPEGPPWRAVEPSARVGHARGDHRSLAPCPGGRSVTSWPSDRALQPTSRANRRVSIRRGVCGLARPRRFDAPRHQPKTTKPGLQGQVSQAGSAKSPRSVRALPGSLGITQAEVTPGRR